MTTTSPITNRFSLILMLGSLTALGPFTIDMYLPAFPKIAEDLHTTVPQVALSLSSYFIGLAVGQLIYGPLLDRYGRKKPLYVGLIIYLLATLACLTVRTVDALILIRLIQALGGCCAGVASVAMVRDFFPAREAAKVFSLIILVLGVSPLVAPTVGGFLAAHFSWQSIFIVLAVIALSLLNMVYFLLPEAHKADPSISLKLGPIFKNYFSILKNHQFATYVFTGASIFAGLFVYLASSPLIFMEHFKVSEQVYGWIFGALSIGFISSSQMNIVFLKKYTNEQVLKGAVIGSVIISICMTLAAWQGVLGLPGIMLCLFLLLAMVGLTNPNASALALAPFSKNAGSASALMGSLQMSVGALATVCVGILNAAELLPLASIFIGTTVSALLILTFGSRKILRKVKAREVLM